METTDDNKFHGKPCLKCGSTLRYKQGTKACVASKVVRESSPKARERQRRYTAENKARLQEYRKQYYAREDIKERNRHADNLRRYGLTESKYSELLVVQREACAICGIAFVMGGNATKMTGPNVDHCHETGVVRGLLCGNCNVFIGLAKEDVQTLAKAIDYLERSRFDRGREWFASAADIEKKPLQSIGLVAGAIVAVVYWVAVGISRIVK